MGWFRNKRDRPIFHAPCPRRFHLLAAIVMVSARAGMMRLLKMLFCFFLNERFFMFSNIKFIVSVFAICAGILLICCLVAEVPIMLMQMAHTANHALV